MSLGYSGGDKQPELAAYRAIDIECEECGRTKRMQPPAIAAAVRGGTRTLIGLHNKLYCSACRDRGLQGRNINLYPKERGGK
jgi:hypothetical protein